MRKSSTCGLLGLSRQVYYRALTSKRKSQTRAKEVVCLVEKIRRDMPRIGFRKLYYLLNEPLRDLKDGTERSRNGTDGIEKTTGVGEKLSERQKEIFIRKNNSGNSIKIHIATRNDNEPKRYSNELLIRNFAVITR
jgi:hypothetical protein